MRTKVFFFSLLMGLVMVGNVQSAYAEGDNNTTKIKIPLIETDGDAYDDRSLTIIPLEAYYQNGTIYLDFTYNVGNVQISVRNKTTGNSWSGTVNSADGMGEISIFGGGAGSYTLTFATAYGDCFIGNFNL